MSKFVYPGWVIGHPTHIRGLNEYILSHIPRTWKREANIIECELIIPSRVLDPVLLPAKLDF